MKLFLDDVRQPPDDSWTVARSVTAAKRIVRQCDNWEAAMLDHDLGERRLTGEYFVLWCIGQNRWPIEKPIVISANPYGAMRMREAIDKFWPRE